MEVEKSRRASIEDASLLFVQSRSLPQLVKHVFQLIECVIPGVLHSLPPRSEKRAYLTDGWKRLLRFFVAGTDLRDYADLDSTWSEQHNESSRESLMSDANESADLSQWVQSTIEYYNHYGLRQLIVYRILKIVSICAGALVPVAALHTSTISWGSTIVAVLGAVAVACEAANQVLRCHDNWVCSVKAAEALENESLLFEANAGVYLTATDPKATFAERIVAITSLESNQWVRNQLDANRRVSSEKTTDASKAPNAPKIAT